MTALIQIFITVSEIFSAKEFKVFLLNCLQDYTKTVIINILYERIDKFD